MSRLRPSETTRHRLRSHAFVSAAALAVLFLSPPAVRAQDAPAASLSCATDIQNLQQKRLTLINEFNQMAKAHEGKLDPIESCPKLKTLASVEASFVAYMTKNKDWCNIPDEAISNVTQSQAKSAALATRVCNVAVQVKKQQEQQAAGGGGGAPAPKLPTGPL